MQITGILLCSLLLVPSTAADPPSNNPVMFIQYNNSESPITDGQVVDITTGQSVNVQCNVQGGQPSVSSVSITCGRQRNVTKGTQTSLSIDVDKTYNDQVCTCSAEHASGRYNKTTHFTFNVFFGPEEVKATLYTPAVKLCPSKREPIIVDCAVPISEANPKPTVYVSSPLGRRIDPINETQTAGNYTFHFSFIPDNDRGGRSHFHCFASNPINRGMNVTDRVDFEAFVPPQDSPNLIFSTQIGKFRDGQTVTVSSGHPYILTCYVPDVTYPVPMKVFATCAGHQSEAEGIIVSQTITLNKSNDNDTCSCSAVHPSGCYNLTTTIIFNVQYFSVTSFTAITPTQQIVADENPDVQVDVELVAGTNVSFRCQGEGKPRPEMVIQFNWHILNSSQTTPLGSSGIEAVVSKTITREDEGIYMCVASHGTPYQDTRVLVVWVRGKGAYVGGTISGVVAAVVIALVIL